MPLLGDVFIGLVPQTREFVEKLKAELKIVGPQKLPVELDPKTAKAEAAVAKLRAQIALLQQKASRFTLDADDKAVTAKIAGLGAQIAGLERKASNLQLDADNKAAVAKIAALDLQAARLRDGLSRLTADVEINAAETKIAAIDAEVKVLKSDLSHNEVGMATAAAKAQVDALRAQVAKLKDDARIVPELKRKEIDAQVKVLEAELDRVTRDRTVHVNVDTRGGATRRGAGGIGGVLAGLGAALTPGGRNAGSGLSQAGQAFGALPLPAQVGLVGAGVAGIGAIAPIVPALAAATAAIGAFGALALPTLADLHTALSDISTASDKYATASANLNTAIHQSPADFAAYQATLGAVTAASKGTTASSSTLLRAQGAVALAQDHLNKVLGRGGASAAQFASAQGAVALAQDHLNKVLGRGGASAAQIASAQGAVALAQDHLNKLQSSGKASSLQLTAAHDRLAAAQARLNALESRGGASSLVITAARDRLAAAQDRLNKLQSKGGASSLVITAAQDRLAAAQAHLADVTGKSGKALKGLEPDLAAAAKLLTDQGLSWQALTPKQRAAEIALRNNKDAYKALLPSQKDALNALIAEGNAWDKLTPRQKLAATATQGLSATFDKLATAVEPLALDVFTKGLKLANDLLPSLLPLAQAGGKAIGGLLGLFDRFAKSPGFKDFIAKMSQLAGPAILSLGEGLGRIVVALGHLLLAMASPNGARILLGVLTGIAGAINGLATGFALIEPPIQRVLEFVEKHWFTIGPLLELPFKNFFLAIKVGFDLLQGVIRIFLDVFQGHWATAWRDLKNIVTRVGADLEKQAQNIWKAIVPFKLRHEMAVIFDGIRHDTVHIFDLTRHDIKTILNDIYGATIGVAIRLGHNVETQWNSFRHATANIFDGVRHDLATIWNDIFGGTIGVAIRITHNVEAQWNSFRHATANIFDGVRHDIADIFGRKVPAVFTDAVRAIGRVWGKIQHAIAAPVNWVAVNVLDKLFGWIDDVTNFVGLGRPLSTSLKLPGFAKGGFIPGFGGGDQVPALLEKGETVVDKMTTKRLAGVFREAGVPGFATGGPVYGDPLRHAAYSVGRVDQGIDFSGSGPIFAIGPGTITRATTHSGWPGGGDIIQSVRGANWPGGLFYYAEDLKPTVPVGAHVTAATQIADFSGGLEFGFAAPGSSGQTLAWVSHQACYTGDPGCHPTAYGEEAARLMAALKGKGPNVSVTGALLKGIFSGIGFGVTGVPITLDQIFRSLGKMARFAIDLAHGDVGGATRALFGMLKPGAGGAKGELGKMLLALPVTLVKDVSKWLVNGVKKFATAQTAASTTTGFGGGTFTGKIGPTSQTVARYLLSQGASKAGAAGIAATIFGESGNAGPESVGSGGFGLIGWTGNTIGLPAGYHGPTGNVARDWAVQLPGIIGYARARPGGWPGVFARINDPVQAGNVWSVYEAPARPLSDTRPALAKQLFAQGLSKGGLIGKQPCADCAESAVSAFRGRTAPDSTRTYAGGGFIPGFGGGDQVPALLEKGETVVDKMTTKRLAGVFREAGVPGFATGGRVGKITLPDGTHVTDTVRALNVKHASLAKRDAALRAREHALSVQIMSNEKKRAAAIKVHHPHLGLDIALASERRRLAAAVKKDRLLVADLHVINAELKRLGAAQSSAASAAAKRAAYLAALRRESPAHLAAQERWLNRQIAAVAAAKAVALRRGNANAFFADEKRILALRFTLADVTAAAADVAKRGALKRLPRVDKALIAIDALLARATQATGTDYAKGSKAGYLRASQAQSRLGMVRAKLLDAQSLAAMDFTGQTAHFARPWLPGLTRQLLSASPRKVGKLSSSDVFSLALQAPSDLLTAIYQGDADALALALRGDAKGLFSFFRQLTEPHPTPGSLAATALREANLALHDKRLAGGPRTFDSGGWLMPGTSVVRNDTGAPERVTAGGIGALTAGERAILAELRQIRHATQAAPREYGHVLSGTAAKGASRGFYGG